MTEAEGDGFIEDGWLGSTLRVGEQVLLQVTARCERCLMTTLPHGGLPFAPSVLATLASQRDACFGVYASPTQAGEVHVGEEVTLIRP